MDEKRRIVIAGAGVMGGSIALLFARHGYEVAVYDIEQKGWIDARREYRRKLLEQRLFLPERKSVLQGRDLWLRPLWKT